MAAEDSLLWTQGLRYDPLAEYPFVEREEIEVLAKKDSNHPCVYTGTAFVDGSLKGRYLRSRRCGWGATTFDLETGHQSYAVYGPLSAKVLTQLRILRAELWALLHVLRHTLLPLVVYTDCEAVVTGWERGEKWSTSASRPHADACRFIWAQRKMDEGRTRRGVAEEVQEPHHRVAA